MTGANPQPDTEALSRRLREAGLQVSQLESRVRRLETWVWNAGVIATIGALVLGLFLPFLREKNVDDPESSTLLPMVVSAADAGGGPFSAEAGLVSVLLGLLVLGTVIVGIGMVAAAGRQLSRRTMSVLRVLTVIYLIGTIGTWLLVVALAGHFDKVSAFSPATLSLTVGAVLAYGLCRSDLARYE